MSVPYAALLVVIAEAFSKELAKNIGTSAVETLFHQQVIARDLEQIKRVLLEIADFLATKLPNIVYDQSKRAGADLIQMEVVEIVDTVIGSTAVLKDKRLANSPQRFEACTELDEHVERLFEKTGILRTYGQIYYACVGIAFQASLLAYAEMLELEPVRFKALAVRLQTWKTQLSSWLDTSLQGSLGWTDKTLDVEYELSERVLHEMDSRIVGHETRYVLGWQGTVDSSGNYNIQIYGAWFHYDGNKLWGDEPLARFYQLPGVSSATRTQVLTLAMRDRFHDPSAFYNITDGNLSYRPAYDAAATRLGQMLDHMKAYPSMSPPTKKAVAQVQAMLDAIDKALANPLAKDLIS